MFFNFNKQQKKEIILGTGYNMKYPEQKTKIIVPDADRSGHMWVFGTTRVGKTRLIENMIEQDIKKGYSVLIIDPKGDIDLFSKIVQVTCEEKRHNDLMLVTPIMPEYSALIDPLSHHYMSEELVSHIVSGVPTGKEPFFYNVAYEISLVVVQALLLIAKHEKRKPSLSLRDVKNLISRNALEKLKAEIDSIDSDEARQLAGDMKDVLESPQDYYSKVSSSLRTALMELSSGNIGKIIGKADENRFIKKLENNEPVIMVVQLGSMLARKAAFTLGKVILSMIQSTIGRKFATGKKMDPPLAIYMDEAQNFLYYGIDDFFAKAGGANVWLHGFCQSVAMLYKELGKDGANSVLDNTNTKVFMRVPDKDTAKYVSQHYDEIIKYSPILNIGGGITVRETKEDEVKVAEVLNMAKREFYAITYSGCYKGRSLDVSSPYIKVAYPEILIQGT